MSTDNQPRPNSTTVSNEPVEAPSTRSDTISRLLTMPIFVFPDSWRLARSQRSSWRAVVNGSELPGPIAHRVREVVARTRLWRSEQSDVASELCTHFADGLGAGRSADELLKSFGDAGRAARLIRRSKQRARPMLFQAYRLTIRLIGLSFAGLLVTYGVLLVMFNITRPTIARNYITEINARTSVEVKGNPAWPMYMKGIGSLGTIPKVLTTNADPVDRTPESRKAWERDSWPQSPGSPRWNQAAEWVESKSDAIAQIRAAAGRPSLGWKLSDQPPADYDQLTFEREGKGPEARQAPEDNPPLIKLLLPQLGEFCQITRIMLVDARRAAELGDPDRFVADIRTICGIARHADQPTFLISRLVKVAILQSAMEAIEVALPTTLLHETHLQQLAHTLAEFDDAALCLDLDLERNSFHDMLQRTYSDDGRGGGHMTKAGYEYLKQLQTFPEPGSDLSDDVLSSAAGPLTIVGLAPRSEIAREATRLYDVAVSESRTPYWQRERSLLDDEMAFIDQSSIKSMRYSVFRITMPAFGIADRSMAAARQSRDGTLVAIALEAYRRNRGVYPASLDLLVPSLLPAVPIDQYDGQTIKYRVYTERSSQIATVYSIGVDRTDNGGHGPTSTLDAPNISSFRAPDYIAALLADPAQRDHYSGDWILYHSHETPPALPPTDPAAVTPRQ